MMDRTQAILTSTVGHAKPVEKADFERFAADAKLKLQELRKDSPLTENEFLAFHKAWYMFCGHRHLGRIYVELAKEL
jgi:hypothetical protein